MSDNGPCAAFFKRIPFHKRWKLDKELDFDNEYNRDVVEIAPYLHNWQVDLKVPFELSRRDVALIKEEKDLTLRL